jgi:hypothetical protein
VVADGVLGNEQNVGGLTRRATVDELGEHLLFPVGEPMGGNEQL